MSGPGIPRPRNQGPWPREAKPESRLEVNGNGWPGGERPCGLILSDSASTMRTDRSHRPWQHATHAPPRYAPIWVLVRCRELPLAGHATWPCFALEPAPVTSGRRRDFVRCQAADQRIGDLVSAKEPLARTLAAIALMDAEMLPADGAGQDSKSTWSMGRVAFWPGAWCCRCIRLTTAPPQLAPCAPSSGTGLGVVRANGRRRQARQTPRLSAANANALRFGEGGVCSGRPRGPAPPCRSISPDHDAGPGVRQAPTRRCRCCWTPKCESPGPRPRSRLQ